MPITFTLSDAAHKYGIDSMEVDSTIVSHDDAIIGDTVSMTNSWTGNLNLNQPGTISTLTSGGFKLDVTFIYSSPTAGAITGLNLYRAATNELLYSISGSFPITPSTLSSNIGWENVYSGNDVINGNSYDNVLKGYGGNDKIDGGKGTDTVYLSGLESQYQITRNGTSITTTGPDGTDTLLNIERLVFNDKALGFDGNLATGYRLYQAAFNRVPDQSGLGYWIGMIDKGMTLQDVAWNFINSNEFKTLYGANVSDSAFINALYNNVLHRPSDQGGFDYWSNMLASHQISRHAMLAEFSESAENVAQVVGSIQNGVEYIPFHSS